MSWLIKFIQKGGTVKGAIREFFNMNGRMPRTSEINKILQAFGAKGNFPKGWTPKVIEGGKSEPKIGLGEFTLGTAPKTTPKPAVDPRLQAQEKRAQSFREFEARTKAKLERESKQGAYNFALKRAMEIDKRPLKLPEVLKRYENLSKYPDGRSYLIDEVHDIEKGWTLPNIGQNTRQDIVTKIKGFLQKKAEGGLAGVLRL